MTYRRINWLADALRAEGCKVKEVSGWQNAGRPSSSGGFDPQGVTMHHTGAKASNSNPCPTLSTIIHGRPDLGGPLAQVLIGYDGVCHVVASGRANHAGTNNGYGPYYNGDGNAQSVGFEIDYDGTQAISSAQKDAATRAGAACLKKFGHNESWIVTHKETSTTGKWDTGGISGSQWRDLIKKYMAGGGGSDSGNGSDEDMPKHVAGSNPSMSLNGEWQVVEWKSVSGDTKDVISAGDPGFNFDGAFTALLTCKVTGTPPSGGVFIARAIEGDFNGPGGDWQVTVNEPPSEKPLSGSTTYFEHVAVQGLGGDDRLRFQVHGPKGMKAENLGVHILFW